uniref:activating signal cointegrator 1-like n=1 Tax=Pristiophorus japonicus TaxID=55135 RepID=UPI00398EF286
MRTYLKVQRPLELPILRPSLTARRILESHGSGQPIKFTDQESGSPFVFICGNPQELLVKFPMKGRHKIWKLDSKIHQGMKKGLMRQKQIA